MLRLLRKLSKILLLYWPLLSKSHGKIQKCWKIEVCYTSIFKTEEDIDPDNY